MGACLGVPERRGSGVGSAFSDSSLSPTTKNKPLKEEKIKWKSDIPLTEFQLTRKRNEFWDTAPAFEGKSEVWAALKAATDAVSKDDYSLAQAILDGAGISLPGGSLVECYDELGTRYSIPIYCLSWPANLISATDRDSPAEFSEPVIIDPVELKVKVRISLTGLDVKLNLNSTDTISAAKKKLAEQEELPNDSRQRWYYGGKLLGDRTRIGEANIPPNHLIQCIVNILEFDIIQTQ
ncbi:ubiquitin domain-containing protein 1 [Eurytemora carolleeae]|uniref:ubiquitin domain-containing protein 1 n=1 Tax=Eurytemora carolleeae TaxID=1294199 RepID=UPI000C793F24|nr:ubiquitin domain-containing protein 1 [Eurytemora carolleeae]XP_023322701.1 ubiquitin domain-containing protein 1 [Eurytemora carolleeae]XP_023322702.1 ubiquitin domain-containing protein 1 [Eurytemora carolleeae]|eukprot:XP_023322699.1 ubiquitin domain-containing protein 1-like [Eurytemora affinis]